jgi:hypothetical protein
LRKIISKPWGSVRNINNILGGIVMSGEESKNSGEFGERIVEKLLKKIGWVNLTKGININCSEPEKHGGGKKGIRKKHGIDFLFSYDCPLFNFRREDVLISVKHVKKYSNVRSNYKNYLKDIAFSMECFDYEDEFRSSTNSSINKVETSGVIFWLSNDKDEKDKDVIEAINRQSFRYNDDVTFNAVYLVDNKRALFLNNVISFVENTFPGRSMNFVYPSTGYNYNTIDKQTKGKILPLQFLNSMLIPIRLEIEKKKILLLFCNDLFDEDNLKRLIGLSHNLTEDWGNETIILFPDYNSLKHNPAVSKVKRQFRDQDFVSSVKVMSFLSDLQTLGE